MKIYYWCLLSFC
jgi:hypothetical protein